MRSDDLILVIDLQNAYLPGQPWGCDSIGRSIGNILALLRAAEARRDGPELCFTRFVSDPGARGVWAEYNRRNRDINENPWMNALVAELAPYAARHPLYTKSVYSSLRVPALRRAARRAGRLVVTGVMCECCVLASCLDAIDLGCHVLYLPDACSGDDAVMEERVRNVLKGLSPLHVTVLDTAAYVQEEDVSGDGSR